MHRNAILDRAPTLVEMGLSLLFPLHCIGCHARDALLCDRCLHDIQDVGKAEARCPFCFGITDGRTCDRHRAQTLERADVLWSFNDPRIRAAIHGMKYQGLRSLASRLCVIDSNVRTRLHETVDVIVPIPIHWTKRNERGYNQAEDIAIALSAVIDRPVFSLLKRGKVRRSQAGLSSREERITNADGLFVMNDNAMKAGSNSLALTNYPNSSNAHFLLVDDVITSGATLESAAVTLASLGGSVSAFCLARETTLPAH